MISLNSPHYYRWREASPVISGGSGDYASLFEKMGMGAGDAKNTGRGWFNDGTKFQMSH